jgi:hypothetical protein
MSNGSIKDLIEILSTQKSSAKIADMGRAFNLKDPKETRSQSDKLFTIKLIKFPKYDQKHRPTAEEVEKALVSFEIKFWKCLKLKEINLSLSTLR